MPSAKTLTATNLEALGAARLAQLLIEISKGDAAAQRRLRLALAGSAGAAEAARAIGKRLNSIGHAKTWLGWDKIKPFLAELETHHRAILEIIAPSDPGDAFELLWRLVSCAEPVLERSDDGNGRLSAAFHAAARDLGPLAARAALPPEPLAERIVRALVADGYNTWDELIPIMAPQLGAAGLGMVKQFVRAWQAEQAATQHADEARSRRRISTIILQQVADALGDVDGFIEQFDARARKMPGVAADIARRLLGAGRPEEAWATLEAVDSKHRDPAHWEWEQAHVDVLEALGRLDEAQKFRWQRFLATLNAAHLRAYLKKLPAFDDFDAEQRAFAHALAFADIHQALAFLVAWPALQQANTLVLSRAQALNGDLYELLSPSAEALDARYPLAATLLRRAMISFTLGASRSSRYKHTARHLRECRAAAAQIEFGSLPDHSAYERTLRATHGRKAGFWHQVEASS